MSRLMVLALILFAAGCQEPREIVAPPPEPERVSVGLTLTLEPREGGIGIQAVARNTGNVGVSVSGLICGSPGMDFRFFDSEGSEVQISCECSTPMGCPVFAGTLKPAEETYGVTVFGGQLWNGSAFVPAPPGEYRVTARFVYGVYSAGRSESVVADTTFVWGPQS